MKVEDWNEKQTSISRISSTSLRCTALRMSYWQFWNVRFLMKSSPTVMISNCWIRDTYRTCPNNNSARKNKWWFYKGSWKVAERGHFFAELFSALVAVPLVTWSQTQDSSLTMNPRIRNMLLEPVTKAPLSKANKERILKKLWNIWNRLFSISFSSEESPWRKLLATSSRTKLAIGGLSISRLSKQYRN